MTGSRVPMIMRELTAGFTTALAGVARVSLGEDLSEDPGAFLWVGVEDPLASSSGEAASSRQVPATIGPARSRDQEGEVVCAVWVQRGDDDMLAALAAAEQIVELAATWLRTASFAALPGIVWAGFGSSEQWFSFPGAAQCAWLVTFRVAFKARV